MSEQNIKKLLYDYIKASTLADVSLVKEETLLFEEGIFDSMGLLLLIEFLKEKFDVHTSDQELVLENFESINAVAGFIKQKQNQTEEM